MHLTVSQQYDETLHIFRNAYLRSLESCCSCYHSTDTVAMCSRSLLVSELSGPGMHWSHNSMIVLQSVRAIDAAAPNTTLLLCAG